MAGTKSGCDNSNNVIRGSVCFLTCLVCNLSGCDLLWLVFRNSKGLLCANVNLKDFHCGSSKLKVWLITQNWLVIIYSCFTRLSFFCGRYFKECVGDQNILVTIDFHCMEKKKKKVSKWSQNFHYFWWPIPLNAFKTHKSIVIYSTVCVIYIYNKAIYNTRCFVSN